MWTYEYDALGNIIRETDFTGRVLTYRRNAAGELMAKINGAGEEITYTRDETGLLETRTVGEEVTRFERDRAGRMIRALFADSALEYTYDEAGRIVAETVDGRTMAHVYDANGHRIRRTTPAGAVSEWDFDTRGLPVALRTGAGRIDYEYDLSRRETARQVAPGAAVSSAYDEFGQLVGQALWRYPPQPAAHGVPETAAAAAPELTQHYWYNFGADRRLESAGERIAGNRTFALDPDGRITSVASGDHAETYAYDRLGNLLRSIAPAMPDTQGDFLYSKGLLRKAGRSSYEYDAQNRLTRVVRRTLSGQRRTWQFTWNGADQLTEVGTADGAVWRYTYDPLGRRTSKRRIDEDGRAVQETVFVWDGYRPAEQYETGPDAVTVTTWDWDPGTPRACIQRTRDTRQRDQDAAFYAIITDLVGTPVDLVDRDGRIAWHRSSTLWGATLAEADSGLTCPLRFPGQYADSETGLHYNFHRYYDPATTQYLSPDPLGLTAGPNDRAYPANPLIDSDPLGLATYGQIPLNDPTNVMAQLAAGRHQNESAGLNIAVYRLGTEPNVSYIGAVSDPGGLHSEEKLDAHLQANGISPDQVTGVYSERVPCVTDPNAAVQHNCAKIVDGYPNAKNDLYFSLASDHFGKRQAWDNKNRIMTSKQNYQPPASPLPFCNWI